MDEKYIKDVAAEYEYYTYDDVIKIDDGNRYELIDGRIYMMSNPSRAHQKACGELHVLFHDFLKGKSCEVYISPFAIRLNAGKNNEAMLLPDLLVACDESKFTDNSYNGPPSLVIEILSPSTTRHDRVTKYNKYLQAGVPEYWIVNPVDKSLAVHLLEGGKYTATYYEIPDVVPVQALPGCEIELEQVFG